MTAAGIPVAADVQDRLAADQRVCDQRLLLQGLERLTVRVRYRGEPRQEGVSVRIRLAEGVGQILDGHTQRRHRRRRRRTRCGAQDDVLEDNRGEDSYGESSEDHDKAFK